MLKMAKRQNLGAECLVTVAILAPAVLITYPSEMEHALASVEPLYLCLFKGPFRDPTDVQKQRYKEFQPSLRVATSFTSQNHES